MRVQNRELSTSKNQMLQDMENDITRTIKEILRDELTKVERDNYPSGFERWDLYCQTKMINERTERLNKTTWLMNLIAIVLSLLSIVLAVLMLLWK